MIFDSLVLLRVCRIESWLNQLFSTREIVAKWKIDNFCGRKQGSSHVENLPQIITESKGFKIKFDWSIDYQPCNYKFIFQHWGIFVSSSSKSFVYLFCFCRIRECPCTGVGGFRRDFGKLKMWARKSVVNFCGKLLNE